MTHLHYSQLQPGARFGGSHVFDLSMSWRGLRVNTMCAALSHPHERDSYKADEEAFMVRFGLSEEEKAMVRARDYSALLVHVAYIY